MISCSRCDHDGKKILLMKVMFISFQAKAYALSSLGGCVVLM